MSSSVVSKASSKPFGLDIFDNTTKKNSKVNLVALEGFNPDFCVEKAKYQNPSRSSWKKWGTVEVRIGDQLVRVKKKSFLARLFITPDQLKQAKKDKTIDLLIRSRIFLSEKGGTLSSFKADVAGNLVHLKTKTVLDLQAKVAFKATLIAHERFTMNNQPNSWQCCFEESHELFFAQAREGRLHLVHIKMNDEYKVGKGGNGAIYKVFNLMKGEFEVLKALHKHLLNNEYSRNNLIGEAANVARINPDGSNPLFQKPYYAQIDYSSKSVNLLGLLGQYYPLGSLDHAINGGCLNKLAIGERINIAKKIAQGVVDLLKKGMANLDIKLGNYLVDQDLNSGEFLIRMCDLAPGNLRTFDKNGKETNAFGSPSFTPKFSIMRQIFDNDDHPSVDIKHKYRSMELAAALVIYKVLSLQDHYDLFCGKDCFVSVDKLMDKKKLGAMVVELGNCPEDIKEALKDMLAFNEGENFEMIVRNLGWLDEEIVLSEPSELPLMDIKPAVVLRIPSWN